MANELHGIIKLKALLEKDSSGFVVAPNGQLISVSSLFNDITFRERFNPKDLEEINLIAQKDIINLLAIVKQKEMKVDPVIDESDMTTYSNRGALYHNFDILGRRCLAGGIESVRNKYTAHHDNFAKDGGKTTIPNISPILNLEHSGIHILANDSHKDKKEIYMYLKELKAKRKLVQTLIEYQKITETEIKQFHSWLEEKLISLGYEPTETGNDTLIYKRAYTKNRPQ